MKDGKPPKGRRGLTSEDQKLWDRMAKDFEPLRKAPKKHVVESEQTHESPPDVRKAKPQKVKNWTSVDVEAGLRDVVSRQGQEIDGRTSKRLKQGKMDVEGVLDLHGMTQEQAHRSLIAFIHRSYQQGKRCVLVITGKGKRNYPDHQRPQHFIDPEPGVLKRRVPDWLRDKSLSPMILQWEQARPSDGGDGALYVLLRRQRTK